MGKVLGGLLLVLLSGGLVAVPEPAAAASGMIFISNERDNTITVLNPAHEVVETIQTCARPRGMHFSADRSQFYVGCADDGLIAIYETATRKLVGRQLEPGSG